MKIDWKNIKKKYPKAFEVLVKDHETIEEWGEIDNPTIWGVHIEEPHWVIRHLYDFFDSKEIYINVTVKTLGKTSFMIIADTTVGGYGFNDRTDAEISAFTKAFEVLEDKLKNRN